MFKRKERPRYRILQTAENAFDVQVRSWFFGFDYYSTIMYHQPWAGGSRLMSRTFTTKEAAREWLDAKLVAEAEARDRKLRRRNFPRVVDIFY